MPGFFDSIKNFFSGNPKKDPLVEPLLGAHREIVIKNSADLHQIIAELDYSKYPTEIKQEEVLANKKIFRVNVNAAEVFTPLQHAKFALNSALIRKLSLIARFVSIYENKIKNVDEAKLNGEDLKEFNKNKAKLVSLLTLGNQAIASYEKLLAKEKELLKYKLKNDCADFIKTLLVSTYGERHTQNNISELRNAERIFIADFLKGLTLVNESTLEGNINLSQTDEFINFETTLTPGQKQEYQRIHEPQWFKDLTPEKQLLLTQKKQEYQRIQSETEKQPEWFKDLSADEKVWITQDKPQWFKDLAPEEQLWLTQKVPEPGKDDWTQFEMFQSSAMQHLPGVKNTRLNSIVIQNGPKPPITSRSIRTASPVPYEMGLLREQKLNTDENIKQLMNLATKTIEKEQKENKSRVLPGQKPVIFFHSVLSDLPGTPDRSIVKAQREAMERIKTQYPNHKIIYGNDALNRFRMFHNDSSNHIEEILQEAKDNYKYENLSPVGKDAYDNLRKMQDADTKLFGREVPGFLQPLLKIVNAVPLRNKEAYMSSYMQILVEDMGGISVTNCKSGKDRTQLDEMYHHSMRIYHEKYGKLPGYNDSRPKLFSLGRLLEAIPFRWIPGLNAPKPYGDRLNFTKVFCDLFNTLKAHQVCSFNTLGSFGVKDDWKSSITCNDIRNQLDYHHTSSFDRASINKPKIFSSNESADKSTREAKHKAANDKFLNPSVEVIPNNNSKQVQPLSDKEIKNHLDKHLQQKKIDTKYKIEKTATIDDRIIYTAKPKPQIFKSNTGKPELKIQEVPLDAKHSSVVSVGERRSDNKFHISLKSLRPELSKTQIIHKFFSEYNGGRFAPATKKVLMSLCQAIQFTLDNDTHLPQIKIEDSTMQDAFANLKLTSAANEIHDVNILKQKLEEYYRTNTMQQNVDGTWEPNSTYKKIAAAQCDFMMENLKNKNNGIEIPANYKDEVMKLAIRNYCADNMIKCVDEVKLEDSPSLNRKLSQS